MNPKEIIQRLVDILAEDHGQSVRYTEAGGAGVEMAMRDHRAEHPDCPHCKAIADAHTILQTL